MKAALVLLAASASASATSAVHGSPQDPQDARALVLHGGTIHVGDAEGSVVAALAVRDGRVVHAGDVEGARAAAGEAATEIDLEGAVAMPGLQDAHGHVEGLGATLEEVDLTGCASFDELIERVAAAAAAVPAGTWITGRGWDQTLWPGAAFPHHRRLSAAVPDHPVFVRRVDGHAGLANAKALAAAGLDRPLAEDATPEGGRVHVDTENVPTGVLVDTAMSLVARHVPAPDRATRLRRLGLAQQELLSLGVTCVHDMGVDLATLDLLRELEETDALDLRVAVYLWANDDAALADWTRADPRGLGERFRVQGAKLMLDGALGSRGAALLEPYSDAPAERGLLRMSQDELAGRVARCAELGLQPAIHAIGDRANRVVLDVYAERVLRDPAFADLRPRIEHAQVVAPDDLERFGELGVIPSVQPTHATSDMRWAEERVGPARIAGAYAWRRLASERAPLALGSDFPVESPNPCLGLVAARTRCDAAGEPEGGWLPDQRLSGLEALRGFTAGAAFALGEEDERGRLAPGCFADVTVLDVDPVTCDPEELLAARCLLTIVEGEVVHDGRE